MNGSSTSLSSHSSATHTASATTQKVTCRSKAITTHHAARPDASTADFRRIHVAHPLGEIEADRKQGQYRDQGHHQCQQRFGVESVAVRSEHQAGKHNLDPGIHLAD